MTSNISKDTNEEAEQKNEPGSAIYYQGLRDKVNATIRQLRAAPDKYKMGYSKTYQGILNAYREGDVSFDEAVVLLNEIAQERQVAHQGSEPRNDNVSLTVSIGGRVVDVAISDENNQVKPGDMDEMIHLANNILRVISNEPVVKSKLPVGDYGNATTRRNFMILERAQRGIE